MFNCVGLSVDVTEHHQIPSCANCHCKLASSFVLDAICTLLFLVCHDSSSLKSLYHYHELVCFLRRGVFFGENKPISSFILISCKKIVSFFIFALSSLTSYHFVVLLTISTTVVFSIVIDGCTST